MIDDKQLSTMIIETYTNTKLLVENVRFLTERTDKQETKIDHLEGKTEQLERRITEVEEFKKNSEEVIEQSKLASRVVHWILEHKIKFFGYLFIAPALLYTLFVLWFVDPRAIDVKPLRYVSAFLLDPLVDGLMHNNISHSEESDIFPH